MTTDAEALYDDDFKNEAYHDNIKELEGVFREYVPLMNRVASVLNKSIFDGSDALSSILRSREVREALSQASGPAWVR
ncbi:hypothetical protein D1007_44826 [Hordeum vulgare]|nr:hypothetical protein D1007_44826 [Hordeum vulgare]